jgi:hypothetical protein
MSGIRQNTLAAIGKLFYPSAFAMQANQHAVVNIQAWGVSRGNTELTKTLLGDGSGFVLDGQGHIATCYVRAPAFRPPTQSGM